MNAKTETTKVNPLAAIATATAPAKPAKAAKAVVEKVKSAAKAKVAEVHAAAAVKKAAKVKAEKPVRITKKDLAQAIVNNNPKASRKEIIGMFMEELGFSAAHSNTYYYLCLAAK